MGVLPTCMLTHPVHPGGEQNKAAHTQKLAYSGAHPVLTTASLLSRLSGPSAIMNLKCLCVPCLKSFAISAGKSLAVFMATPRVWRVLGSHSCRCSPGVFSSSCFEVHSVPRLSCSLYNIPLGSQATNWVHTLFF